MNILEIRKQLFKFQDNHYKQFHKNLVPTLNEELIIGVKVPILRQFAKKLAQDQENFGYLDHLPHHYTEEYNLHAFLVEEIKDFSLVMQYTEKLLPYIDNWATCDIYAPKIFKKHPKEVLEKATNWLKNEHVYTVRFGITTLLGNYLGERFDKSIFDEILQIETDEYYINMAIAWFFSVALIKQYHLTVPLFEEKKIKNLFIHNKSLQKAIESRRVDLQTKTYLKSLKLKDRYL